MWHLAWHCAQVHGVPGSTNKKLVKLLPLTFWYSFRFSSSILHILPLYLAFNFPQIAVDQLLVSLPLMIPYDAEIHFTIVSNNDMPVIELHLYQNRGKEVCMQKASFLFCVKLFMKSDKEQEA